MTNQVNKTFAKAAQSMQQRLHEYLVEAFRPQFGSRAEELVDAAADWMGRNIEEAKDGRPSSRQR